MSVNYKLLRKLKGILASHKRLIIAFDFDDTVYPFSGEDTPCFEVRETLRWAKEQGHILICYTCRSEEEEVLHFCQKEEIHYDKFNENYLQLERQHGKVFYNIFLDDKCGLTEALCTLQEVLRFNHK